jgi:hypothetical protein
VRREGCGPELRVSPAHDAFEAARAVDVLHHLGDLHPIEVGDISAVGVVCRRHGDTAVITGEFGFEGDGHRGRDRADGERVAGADLDLAYCGDQAETTSGTRQGLGGAAKIDAASRREIDALRAVDRGAPGVSNALDGHSDGARTRDGDGDRLDDARWDPLDPHRRRRGDVVDRREGRGRGLGFPAAPSYPALSYPAPSWPCPRGCHRRPPDPRGGGSLAICGRGFGWFEVDPVHGRGRVPICRKRRDVAEV